MAEILVIGEGCIDNFIYCDALRLDPAVPVPILNVIESRSNDGMAKNVVNAIQALGVQCDYLLNDNWQLNTKNRYVDNKSNHAFIRIDDGPKINRIDISKVTYDYKIIVISDYDKGFLHEEDIQKICSSHPLVFIDTKKYLDSWVDNAFIIKINDYEYNNSLKTIKDTFKDKIIHTMGGEGCEYKGSHFEVTRSEVKDASGAGDTFMAALCVKYLQTYDIIKSIKFANRCASEVVKHRGVVPLYELKEIVE